MSDKNVMLTVNKSVLNGSESVLDDSESALNGSGHVLNDSEPVLSGSESVLNDRESVLNGSEPVLGDNKATFGAKRALFYLVRHGQSEGNAREIILGHTDLGLTELGLRQAECTADALATVKFDRIYSSDLLRAMQTAEPNARKRGMVVEPEARLREIFCGDWDGKSVKEIAEKQHDLFFGPWRSIFGTFCMPNGESVPHLAERIYDCLADLGRRHLGEVVLCATHAAAIRAFWGKISGIEPELLGKTLPFPSNASYSIVEFDGERFTPVKYSCDEHFVEDGMKTQLL